MLWLKRVERKDKKEVGSVFACMCNSLLQNLSSGIKAGPKTLAQFFLLLLFYYFFSKVSISCFDTGLESLKNF